MRRVYVLARRLLTYVLCERPSGIQTGGVVQLEELGLDAPHRVRHQPSGWLNLRRILRKSEVSEDDVFIDFGSGMGRVVFQAAAAYPFKRVIGVELSSELNDIAKANVRGARRRLRCKHIELVRSDALNYEIPDDVTIVYFNNPFTGERFSRPSSRSSWLRSSEVRGRFGSSLRTLPRRRCFSTPGRSSSGRFEDGARPGSGPNRTRSECTSSARRLDVRSQRDASTNDRSAGRGLTLEQAVAYAESVD